MAKFVEYCQWLAEHGSWNLAPQKRAEVGHEFADILIYLIRTADQLGIDLIAAANSKILVNEEHYPSEKVRGKALRAENCE